MVGDRRAFDEGASDGPGKAHRAVPKLRMDAVSFDKVPCYLAHELAVEGSTDVEYAEKFPKFRNVRLNPFGGRSISSVISIFVAGLV